MGQSLWHFAKSATFFDLGFDNLNEDADYIKKSISEIENMFSLVLIAEYFEESMILLKERMCWTMDDIIYLKVNQRTRAASWEREKLTPKVVEKIRSWNKADAAIYDHFNATLWKKIDEFGRERMEKEKKKLQGLNDYWADYCVENVATGVDTHGRILHPPGVNVKGYKLRPDRTGAKKCRQLTMTEDTFSNMLSMKQDGHGF